MLVEKIRQLEASGCVLPRDRLQLLDVIFQSHLMTPDVVKRNLLVVFAPTNQSNPQLLKDVQRAIQESENPIQHLTSFYQRQMALAQQSKTNAGITQPAPEIVDAPQAVQRNAPLMDETGFVTDSAGQICFLALKDMIRSKLRPEQVMFDVEGRAKDYDAYVQDRSQQYSSQTQPLAPAALNTYQYELLMARQKALYARDAAARAQSSLQEQMQNENL